MTKGTGAHVDFSRAPPVLPIDILCCTNTTAIYPNYKSVYTDMANVALIGGTGMVVSAHPANKAPQSTPYNMPKNLS